MPKKITYIVSNLEKALAFEWIADYLDKKKFILNFILLNPGNSVLEEFLRAKQIPVHRILFHGKKDLPAVIFRIVTILLRNKPEVVHTHLFYANVAGLMAAWICRVPNRIYTRHHSTYHHMYHPGSVKYDRLTNFLATGIVAISKTVEELLIEKEDVRRKKIKLIHHGFMLDDFRNVPADSVTQLHEKYNPSAKHPVIGVISRYTEWKGIQFIIPAFKKLLEKYPQAMLLLANAEGDYSHRIKSLLRELPENSFAEIRFENNIFALYKLFDVFVHTPIDKYSEAFGQTYVEALASGVPSVFTLSGIANEFIIDRQNALVVPYKNSEAVYYAIQELLTDSELASELLENGKKGLEEKFSLHNMISSLEELYTA
ncbi:MAG TPA: glycosyltransferase family 4 protein [Bacteroidia bacterium]|nr:glycosyltransferase family 4 protein [Bacteroidia bacterium]